MAEQRIISIRWQGRVIDTKERVLLKPVPGTAAQGMEWFQQLRCDLPLYFSLVLAGF